jgi:predicted ester cyclase
MIDLVYWSFLAALLPIILHVCVRILSQAYWSILAPVLPIVLHGREIPLQLPKESKKNTDTKSKTTPEKVVLTFLDASNKNDLDGAMACLADDFVRLGESTKWVPMSKKNYRDMWARFAVAFPDFKWETSCMVTSGDTVAIEVIETGTFTEPWAWQGKTLRPNDKGYRARICVFFRVNKRGLIQHSEEEGTGIANRARSSEQASDRRSFFRPASASYGRHAWDRGVKSGHNRFFSSEL